MKKRAKQGKRDAPLYFQAKIDPTNQRMTEQSLNPSDAFKFQFKELIELSC